MALKQSDADWFRPLWRRVVVTAVVAAWCGYEVVVSHEQLWIAITGVALVYCVWNFFLRFPKSAPPVPPADPPGPASEPAVSFPTS
jgi:hypothetical protein